MAIRGRRYVVLGFLCAALTVLLLTSSSRRDQARDYFNQYLDPDRRPSFLGGTSEDQGGDKRKDPIYRPKPDWTPPPVQDPFPLLSTGNPPPIPEWNRPKKDLHKDYGIDFAPPLYIGFSRNWPMVLQAVVSYITAGWPPEQIHVVENTGVQRANLEGKLTLQNPYYFNHEQMRKLGVNVVRAPVLMNFAQLQNFYVHLAHEMDAPQYFWSHMDVLVLSYEDGNELTPPYTDPGYKTVYELCLQEMNHTLSTDDHWSDRFFAYDHLTLVNREAYEEVGGWDTFIPYYITDCDMHTRLHMHNWTIRDAKAGIITDVGSALDNLLALYRDPSVEVKYVDSNPAPPEPEKKDKRGDGDGDDLVPRDDEDPQLAYWKRLQAEANNMFHYKHSRDRNTWQRGQHGGQGEPFYYDSRGIAESIEVLTEAGREVYRRKWGHENCDILGQTKLKLEDQWLVEKDW